MTTKKFENGFTDVKEVEMMVHSAEHVVGNATNSLADDALDKANHVIHDAQATLNKAKSTGTGVDGEFLEEASLKLQKAAHQLNEAKK